MRCHPLAWRLLLLVGIAATVTPYSVTAAATSLRFFGSGVDDIDRVKILLDPHVPADIGASDWTLEFWMKAQASENSALNCPSTNGEQNWINGSIIFDRDIFGVGGFPDYGISLYGTGLAFGASSVNGDRGLCGSATVADGRWHHVAVTRREMDGEVRLYVDGQLDAIGNGAGGPRGDMSYNASHDDPDWPNNPYLVIGAEKHDVGRAFSGWIDEVRISNVLRYTSDTSFVPPKQPFMPDVNTAALYHFDEGSGNTITDSAGPSNGVRRFPTDGRAPAGPEWSSDTPFSGTPSPPPPPTPTPAPAPDPVPTPASPSTTMGGGGCTLADDRSVDLSLYLWLLILSALGYGRALCPSKRRRT